MAPALNDSASNKDFNLPNSPSSSNLDSPLSSHLSGDSKKGIKIFLTLDNNKNSVSPLNKISVVSSKNGTCHRQGVYNCVVDYGNSQKYYSKYTKKPSPSLKNGVPKLLSVADETSSNKMNHKAVTVDHHNLATENINNNNSHNMGILLKQSNNTTTNSNNQKDTKSCTFTKEKLFTNDSVTTLTNIELDTNHTNGYTDQTVTATTNEPPLIRKSSPPPPTQPQHTLESTLNTMSRAVDSIKSISQELSKRVNQFRLQQLHTHIKTELKHLSEVVRQKSELPVPPPKESANNPEQGEVFSSRLNTEEAKHMSTAALVKYIRRISNSDNNNKSQDSYTLNKITSNSTLCSPTVDTNLTDEELCKINKVSRKLKAKLQRSAADIDPEATDDSSCESGLEEMCSAKPMIRTKRNHISKKWAQDRADHISRCVWLQAQIGSIEHQVRQQNEYLNHLKISKNHFTFEGLPYHNQPKEKPAPLQELHLTSSNSTCDNNSKSLLRSPLKDQTTKPKTNGLVPHNNLPQSQSAFHIHPNEPLPPLSPPCSRTCPVTRAVKRKLYTTENLPAASPKAAKLSTVSCNCRCIGTKTSILCINCSRRYNYSKSLDADTMPYPERLSILDPSYHPILSLDNDVDFGVQVESKLRAKKHKHVFKTSVAEKEEIRPSIKKIAATNVPRPKYQFSNNRHKKKKSMKLKRKRNYKVDYDSEDETFHPYSSEFKRRKFNNSCDLDNVVMPTTQSIVSKLEAVQYKEIITPKWRLFELPLIDNLEELEGEMEDLSEEAFISRHDKCEAEEKRRYFYQKNRKGRQKKNSEMSLEDNAPVTPASNLPSRQSSPIPSPLQTNGGLSTSSVVDDGDFSEDKIGDNSLRLEDFSFDDKEINEVLNSPNSLFDFDVPDLNASMEQGPFDDIAPP